MISLTETITAQDIGAMTDQRLAPLMYHSDINKFFPSNDTLNPEGPPSEIDSKKDLVWGPIQKGTDSAGRPNRFSMFDIGKSIDLKLLSRPGSHVTSDNFGNVHVRINPLPGQIDSSYDSVRDVTSSQDLGTQAKIYANRAVDYTAQNPVRTGLGLAGVAALGYGIPRILKRNNNNNNKNS